MLKQQSAFGGFLVGIEIALLMSAWLHRPCSPQSSPMEDLNDNRPNEIRPIGGREAPPLPPDIPPPPNDAPPRTHTRFPLLDDDVFSRSAQSKALAASCRILTDRGGGTGTYIGQNWHGHHMVLTAFHVIDGCSSITIHFYSAASYPQPSLSCSNVYIVAVRKREDLALLRIDVGNAELPSPIAICPPSLAPATPQGLQVITVGCNQTQPTLLRGTTRGLISTSYLAGRPWELSFAAYPGRSGGACIDERQYLIGVCWGSIDGHGVYPSLQEIYALCRQANMPHLCGINSPLESDLLIAGIKLLIAKALFLCLLQSKGASCSQLSC